MQKKDNQKAKDEIAFYERLIAMKQEEDGIEEPIEVDGIDEPLQTEGGLNRKRSQLNTRGSTRS